MRERVERLRGNLEKVLLIMIDKLEYDPYFKKAVIQDMHTQGAKAQLIEDIELLRKALTNKPEDNESCGKEEK